MKLRHLRPSAAFTLLEIMLVVAIIALLLGVAIMTNARNLIGAKEVVARSEIRSEIQSFVTALEQYRLRAGVYPTTEQGLQALVERPKSEPQPKRWSEILPKIKTDPWGNAYIYVCPFEGDRDQVQILSKGADGKEKTEDDIVYPEE